MDQLDQEKRVKEILEPFAIDALKRIAIAVGMGAGNWHASEVANRAILLLDHARKKKYPWTS